MHIIRDLYALSLIFPMSYPVRCPHACIRWVGSRSMLSLEKSALLLWRTHRCVIRYVCQWQRSHNVACTQVINASDVPPWWSVEKTSLAMWRVHTFHSWVTSKHSVASVSPMDGTQLRQKRLRFREPAGFNYGQYAYCSKRRYYIAGVRELLLETNANATQGW